MTATKKKSCHSCSHHHTQNSKKKHCWQGYKATGTQYIHGKAYNICKKK